VASKLQKEVRRDKKNNKRSSGGDGSDYKASYRRLEEWLDEKGDGIGVSLQCEDDVVDDGKVKEDGAPVISSCITLDIWTDDRPEDRPEYDEDDADYCNDYDDEDHGRNNNKGRKGKGDKVDRGLKIKKGRGKGKSHPNAKNKFPENNESAGSSSRERSGSIASSHHNNLNDDRLCSQEFFHGKEKCKGTSQQFKQQRQKGGGRGRGDSIGGHDDNGGCNFQHYHQLPKVKRKQKGTGPRSTQPMTLVQVLNEKFQPHHIQNCSGDDNSNNKPTASLPPRVREATLKSSFNATFNAQVSDADGVSCIDMIYHSRFFVDNKAESGERDDSNDSEDEVEQDSDGDSNSSDKNEDNDEQDDDGQHANKDVQKKKSKVHDTLEQILDKDKLPPASIVYLAIQGVLIYDRHRGGLVFTENEEQFLLFGHIIDDSSADENMHLDHDSERSSSIHEQLTHHLLDEVLSYCKDESTAILPQVCSSWHDEVGTRSPQLWKMLLGRHDWPLSVNGVENEASSDVLDECQRFRNTFTSHYTVVRDVRAMVSACNTITGGSANDKHGLEESAIQIYKATKGSPVLDGSEENQCMVKIWPDAYDESASTRALAAYKDDCSLRLFEVVRGGSHATSSAKARIKCRQIVCLRAAPPSISKKKDSCEMMSMDLDNDQVACIVEESLDQNEQHSSEDLVTPWMTVISREDVMCAGNEGMLEDDCVKSHDLRAVILDFMLGDVDEHEESREALHNYLAMYDGDTSDIHISVTPKLVACGKGHFLFHAFIRIPGYSEMPLDGEEMCTPGSNRPESRGHRLFLFYTRSASIVKSLHLERFRESTSLFASRPFKRRATTANTAAVLCTNILVSGPTMALLFISVEIRRDGTIDMLQKPMIENEELAPWSEMAAVLTSSHAVFSTDPIQGPLLHVRRILSSHDDINDATGAFHSIEIGGQDCKLHNVFMIREQYIGVIIGTRPNNGEDEDEFDGEWFGLNNESSFEIVIYHIPTCREMYRCPLPSEALSVDCIGDTLAMNVSNLGFAITGGNARDVARMALNEDNAQIMNSPSGKNPKTKKKRLASGASGRKKDGFARGMNMRG